MLYLLLGGGKMKLVVQRVTKGCVTVEGKVLGQIKQGYVVFVGIGQQDSTTIVDKMIEKLIHLRIFSDSNDKMNLSLLDIEGSVLSISQFTLYSDCRNGRRPNFTRAAKAEQAESLYNYFNERLSRYVEVQQGKFGANMAISIENDGPVTIILDSDEVIGKVDE